MILGIGSDIIKNTRIESLLITHKQRFLKRIFTALEVDFIKERHLKKKIGYIAKRFAAKEAFSKALGTGIGKQLSFQDIEIFSNQSGKPYFKFSERLTSFLQQSHGKIDTHLSMSDEEEYSQAFVVIEKIVV